MAHLVGNQTEQYKSNFVFPENCRDVYALISLLCFLLSNERRKIGLQLLQTTLDSLLKIGITLAIFKMLGNTPLWKALLINFAKGAEIITFICFITFAGMLSGSVLFLMLRSEIMLNISSSVVGVIRNCLDLEGSVYNIF